MGIYTAYDNNIKDMDLDQYTFCVINPLDEKPHICDVCQRSVQYQHRRVLYNNDKMSVWFVFRVVVQ